MRAFVLFCLMLSLAGCDRLAPASGEPLELRQYAVPPERTEAIVGTLNGVMLGNEHQPGVGRASSRVEGQVVVLAPARMHASIEKTIASLAQTDPAARAVGSVRVEYWIVDALPGAGDDDAGLAPVQAALEVARPTLGDIHFARVEQVALVSATSQGASAETLGRTVNVQHRLTPAPGGVFAQIEIRPNARRNADGGIIDMRVAAELPFGQTLLLAQQDVAGDVAQVRRLILVRAQPVGAQ